LCNIIKKMEKWNLPLAATSILERNEQSYENGNRRNYKLFPPYAKLQSVFTEVFVKN